jgi:hypothetical protein
MSNIALFEGFEGKLPTHLNGVDEDTKALAGGVGGMRRISIKGGVFREMIGGKEVRSNEERAMNFVVVRVSPHNSRQYFAGAYVEGEKARPVCWSSDGSKPEADVKDKQAANCASCPQNIKGSGQGESRACRYQRRLAVMVDGEIEKREVYQLIAPATSVFGDGERGKMPLQKYAQHLQAHQTPITQIVTEMRFDTASTQPKLTFKAIRPLTDEEYAVVVEMRDSKEAVGAITLNVSQTDGEAPRPALFDNSEDDAPPPVKAAAKKAEAKAEAKAPPKAEPEDAAEPEVAAPTKVSSKKPVPEPKLADLVGEWDD